MFPHYLKIGAWVDLLQFYYTVILLIFFTYKDLDEKLNSANGNTNII